MRRKHKSASAGGSNIQLGGGAFADTSVVVVANACESASPGLFV